MGGSYEFIVNDLNGQLDKTYAEIQSAARNGKQVYIVRFIGDEAYKIPVTTISHEGTSYRVSCVGHGYSANSETAVLQTIGIKVWAVETTVEEFNDEEFNRTITPDSPYTINQQILNKLSPFYVDPESSEYNREIQNFQIHTNGFTRYISELTGESSADISVNWVDGGSDAILFSTNLNVYGERDIDTESSVWNIRFGEFYQSPEQYVQYENLRIEIYYIGE